MLHREVGTTALELSHSFWNRLLGFLNGISPHAHGETAPVTRHHRIAAKQWRAISGDSSCSCCSNGSGGDFDGCHDFLNGGGGGNTMMAAVVDKTVFCLHVMKNHHSEMVVFLLAIFPCWYPDCTRPPEVSSKHARYIIAVLLRLNP